MLSAIFASRSGAHTTMLCFSGRTTSSRRLSWTWRTRVWRARLRTYLESTAAGGRDHLRRRSFQAGSILAALHHGLEHEGCSRRLLLVTCVASFTRSERDQAYD